MEKPGFNCVIDGKFGKAKDDDLLQGFAPPLFCNFLSIKRHPGHLPSGASFSMDRAALYTVPVQLPGADRGVFRSLRAVVGTRDARFDKTRSCSFRRKTIKNTTVRVEHYD